MADSPTSPAGSPFQRDGEPAKQFASSTVVPSQLSNNDLDAPRQRWTKKTASEATAIFQPSPSPTFDASTKISKPKVIPQDSSKSISIPEDSLKSKPILDDSSDMEPLHIRASDGFDYPVGIDGLVIKFLKFIAFVSPLVAISMAIILSSVSILLGSLGFHTLLLCLPYHTQQPAYPFDRLRIFLVYGCLFGILYALVATMVMTFLWLGGRYITGHLILTFILYDCCFLALVVTRYAYIQQLRSAVPRKPLSRVAKRWLTQTGVDFRLLVAGSGGHTTELIQMLRHSPPHGTNMHRRWLVTAGDQRSHAAIKQFEAELRANREDTGTFEITTIARARRVHQGWLTVPISALACCYDVYKCVVRPAPNLRRWGYPNVVITNGPGSGFIVAMITYLMRIIFLVPSEECKIIYIESIARVKTLSLTGRLFYWTKIADRFIVQQRPLRERYPGTHLEENLAARE